MIRVLAYLYLVVLFLLMVIPIGNGTLITDIYIINYRGDYILHCLVYLPWMFAGKIILGKRLNTLGWLALGAATAAALEYIQMLLPYRGFNINDLVAGVIGVVVSYIAITILKYITRPQTRTK